MTNKIVKYTLEALAALTVTGLATYGLDRAVFRDSRIANNYSTTEEQSIVVQSGRGYDEVAKQIISENPSLNGVDYRAVSYLVSNLNNGKKLQAGGNNLIVPVYSKK